MNIYLFFVVGRMPGSLKILKTCFQKKNYIPTTDSLAGPTRTRPIGFRNGAGPVPFFLGGEGPVFIQTRPRPAPLPSLFRMSRRPHESRMHGWCRRDHAAVVSGFLIGLG